MFHRHVEIGWTGKTEQVMERGGCSVKEGREVGSTQTGCV